jgi:hypothetical protein
VYGNKLQVMKSNWRGATSGGEYDGVSLDDYLADKGYCR